MVLNCEGKWGVKMGWQQRLLCDIIQFKNGKKRPVSEGAIPVYGGNGILGYTNTSNYNQCVIIGRVGAYCGSVYYEKNACWVSDNAIAAQPKGETDILFVYYLLKSLNLNGRHIGTSQPLLTQEILNRIECKIPPLQVQRQIASVLSLIDNKIMANCKTNDNLQQQARTLSKQWLSDNYEDFEMLPLSQIAEINPDTYSLKEGWEYINYLDTSNITDGIISEIQHIDPNTEKLPSRARRKIVANDVVFSTVRPNQRHFGIINTPKPNMLVSTGFAVIRSTHPRVCNELIYLCLTENDFIEKMQQLAEQSTSTFPSIKSSDLGVCEIPCPNDDSYKELQELLKAAFTLISVNQQENNYLLQIRNVFLPRLMSGEIGISNIQL